MNEYIWDVLKIFIGASVGAAVTWHFSPPSTDPSDVANEYVVVISEVPSETSAWEIKTSFKNIPAQGKEGDCGFGYDQISVVRSVWNKGQWAVVIDPVKGEGESNEVENKLNRFKSLPCADKFSTARVGYVSREEYRHLYGRDLVNTK